MSTNMFLRVGNKNPSHLRVLLATGWSVGLVAPGTETSELTWQKNMMSNVL